MNIIYILPTEIIWLILYFLKKPKDILAFNSTAKIFHHSPNSNLWSYLISSLNLNYYNFNTSPINSSFIVYKNAVKFKNAIVYVKHTQRIDYIYFYKGYPLNDDLLDLPGFFGIENDRERNKKWGKKTLTKSLPKLINNSNNGVYAMYIQFSNLTTSKNSFETIIKFYILYKKGEIIQKITLKPTNVKHVWGIKKYNKNTYIKSFINELIDNKTIISPLSI